MAQKRKSTHDTTDGFIDDSATKKSKKSSPTFTPASKTQKDSNGDAFWEISKARRVTISDFKDKKMVSVREYYEKDGEWLPGKKGISMTLEQFSALVELLPCIEGELRRSGVEDFPRPIYGEIVESSRKEEEESEQDKGRANHEATSDEED